MYSRVSPSNGERRREFLALANSACRRQFVGVEVGVLHVKSLVEHDGEG